MSHYAQAFYVEADRCFRFIHSGVGHASHCREPVSERGQFVDAQGKWWTVEACSEHGDELTKPQ